MPISCVNTYSTKVLVEGHTERGTPEYNIALGERRAKAVAKYLQNLGVDPTQLSVVSYGEEASLIQVTAKMPLPKTVVLFWFTKV